MTLFGIFLEGLLSFLSPCILPLVPLYVSYLSKGAKEVNEEGEVVYRKGSVFLTTVFFVLGICTTFFILGLSLSFIKTYIQAYIEVIGLIGGVLLIFFGLFELELISIPFLSKKLQLETHLSLSKMNIFKSYFIGFIFSFGWTPCVGPLLGNVLILAASESVLLGNLYIAVYALGFVIPFLILGIFTRFTLEFLKKHQKLFAHTMKLAGIIILMFGFTMIYDNAKQIKSYKENYHQQVTSNDPYLSVFKDHNGNDISLSDYKDEYVMVNYITTWCTYCKQEIPEYQSFLKENDIKGIFVMSPIANGGSKEEIVAFAKENGVEIPILIDEDGFLFNYYGVNSYPTLTVLGPDGTYLGYVLGALNQSQLDSVFKEAVKRYEAK